MFSYFNLQNHLRMLTLYMQLLCFFLNYYYYLFAFSFCSKREVNKKVLKVPGIEQKVQMSISQFFYYYVYRHSHLSVEKVQFFYLSSFCTYLTTIHHILVGLTDLNA